jgi:uncharacterized 2Fe-2S/4Fe-4S cluster protein (DUF4445 family)
VREAIDDLIDKVCKESGGSTATTFSTRSSSATRSCTTCFSASTRRNWAARPSRWPCPARSRWASDLDLPLNPGARVYMLPCIAGHVGADAAAATLTEGPHRQDEMMLLVDVGTNAEIVLGNSSASSPPPRPPARPSRARRSPAASAPRPARSSASASTRTRWSRASR